MQYQPSSTVNVSHLHGSQPPPYGHRNDDDGNNNNNMDNNNNNNLLHNELHVVRYAGRQAVCHFLQNYNCWSILKISTKIIVFDVQTPIQLAFYALVEHGMLSLYKFVCVYVCENVVIAVLFVLCCCYIYIYDEYNNHHKNYYY